MIILFNYLFGIFAKLCYICKVELNKNYENSIDMGFKKGNDHGRGRRKGSKNKPTRETVLISALLSHLIDGGLGKFKEEMSLLKGLDYINVIIKILEISPDKDDNKEYIEYAIEFLNEMIKSK